MALIKDNAIVLRRLDFSETSQVLAIFTQSHGQERVIAKGIKRSTKTRVAVGIDPLELGRVVWSRRPGKEDGLATLTEWHQQEHFPHLRRDLVKHYAAHYAAEATSQLTEPHDPHPVLFDSLLTFLRNIATGIPLSSLNAFLWSMLTEIGLRPELEQCVGCGRGVEREELLFFSSHQGGALCRDCEPTHVEKRRLPQAVVDTLVLGKNSDPKMPSEVFALLDYHLTETLSRPLKLSGPLRELLKPGR